MRLSSWPKERASPCCRRRMSAMLPAIQVHRDIGLFLRHKIRDHFAAHRFPVIIRYLDPSYYIRSVPASTVDSVLCDSFARHAVHAAMAGKTDIIIGLQHGVFIHVPIPDGNHRAQTPFQRRVGFCGDRYRPARLGVETHLRLPSVVLSSPDSCTITQLS